MRGLAIAALIAVAFLGMIWLFQRRLIYFPSQAVPAVPPGVEEVMYATEDDLTLAAWFLPSAEAGKGVTVMVFNGNAGNRADRAPLGQAFTQRGYSVLLVDYRGYGGNPGSPSESGLRADARAALAFLNEHPEVDRSKLVYFGESLGAAVAVGLAQTDPPAALVLRSPFTSLSDIGSTHYPFLPVSLLLRDHYPNLESIAALEVPVIVIAGSADSIVPPEQSQELFEAAPGPKHLLILQGADHNDLALTAGDRMMDEIAAFLDRVLTFDG